MHPHILHLRPHLRSLGNLQGYRTAGTWLYLLGGENMD